MANGTNPRVLGSVILATILLFTFTGFLARTYREQRHDRAEQHHERGEMLAKEGSYEQAAAEFRAALSFAHSDRKYALALALALMEMGKWAEASAHLIELRESDPSSGIVNLMLARIAARQARPEEAVGYYHTAIFGFWPAQAEENRTRARFELVNLLAKTGHTKMALAELLELAGEAPNEPDVKKRIATLFMQLGSPANAAEIYQDVVQLNPKDTEAYVGLGEAEFAAGDFRQAQGAFRRAVRLSPKESGAWMRLEQANQAVELDPTLVRINSQERYRRSRDLLQIVLESLNKCTADSSAALAPADQQLVTSAEAILGTKQKKRGQQQDALDLLNLAQQLWKVRLDTCGPPSEEVLPALMKKVSS